jgi:hypothetical protein
VEYCSVSNSRAVLGRAIAPQPWAERCEVNLLWGREQGNPNWLENEPLAEAADASSESTWEKERSASVVLPKTLFTQNDHVDAPVQLASIFSSIARDGMKLRVAGRGQPGSLEVILHDQQANQFSRPRSR